MSVGPTIDFSEAVHMERLKQVVQQELARCDAVIAARRKEREEYGSVRKLIDDLPKKLTHNIMIPFGSVGYLPGKIVHTNELMVLLGDNLFAERSAHQSVQIIDRRIESVDEAIRNVQSEKKLLNDQLDFAHKLFQKGGETGDEVEIREEYDEEAERIMKEKRRAKAAAANAAKKEKATADKEHEKLMAHLEQLELLESRKKRESARNEEDAEKYSPPDSEDSEDNHMDDEEERDVLDTPPAGVDPEKYAALVSRVNAMLDESTDDEEMYSESDSESDGYSEEGLDSDDLPDEEPKATVTKKAKDVKPMKKTSRVRFPSELESGPSASADMDPETLIQQETAAKSILRNKKPTPVDEKRVGELERADDESRRVLPESKVAFPGEIVERHDPELPSTSHVETEQPKKLSKFKQQRLNR